MPAKQSITTGVENPWYPEGGPGRHLKARLAAGEVMMAPMLSEYARPSIIKLFQHAGYDFIYIEYEHVYFGLDHLAYSSAAVVLDQGPVACFPIRSHQLDYFVGHVISTKVLRYQGNLSPYSTHSAWSRRATSAA